MVPGPEGNIVKHVETGLKPSVNQRGGKLLKLQLREGRASEGVMSPATSVTDRTFVLGCFDGSLKFEPALFMEQKKKKKTKAGAG